MAEALYPQWIQNHPDLRQIRACFLTISNARDVALWDRYVITVCPLFEQFRGTLAHHFAIGSTLLPEDLPKGAEELEPEAARTIREKLEAFLRAHDITPPETLEPQGG